MRALSTSVDVVMSIPMKFVRWETSLISAYLKYTNGPDDTRYRSLESSLASSWSDLRVPFSFTNLCLVQNKNTLRWQPWSTRVHLSLEKRTQKMTAIEYCSRCRQYLCIHFIFEIIFPCDREQCIGDVIIWDKSMKHDWLDACLSFLSMTRGRERKRQSTLSFSLPLFWDKYPHHRQFH